MVEMQDKLRAVEQMSWDSLREMAVKELSAIPTNEHVVFEKMFGVEWPQFEQMITSLVGKSYEEITPVHEKMFILARLSQDEVVELTAIAMFNKTQYKSPKVQYWQICRLIQTKHK